ncbi:tRNA-dihydrouridine(47) synthase [NAD(P)(+)] [Trichodelitschia bisporula]|uniref:tRNA-dihydrouridine(47) synthase [NAD(P)(+)] n=1 Tax=Trichodelitschia bisporula TaxID=703511 RepID=A0A6G1I0U1_9PEZI|nr:tRNA-dihydrouridine(47) synthase [NAD(P)(+)] [Trichodelitschia bisporula]
MQFILSRKAWKLTLSRYLIPRNQVPVSDAADDDAAEASTLLESGSKGGDMRKKGKKKESGQNKNRQYGTWGDSIQLCNSRALAPQFSPKQCPYGEKCRLEHDLMKYLTEGKRENLETLGGICPIWQAKGHCNAGWKCRWVHSHSTKRILEDGREELVLVEDEERKAKAGITDSNKDESDLYNVVDIQTKMNLRKKKIKTPKADVYDNWLTSTWNVGLDKKHNKTADDAEGANVDVDAENKKDERAQYAEPPLLPSEKRRLYYGPETPVLAPLTTQGNMPFRRLCIDLGAQLTWSEMAMGMPLVSGEKGEWALIKAHASEITPPKVMNPGIVAGYDQARDLKFGVQIAANKPWIALKTTEILSTLCPRIRAIDLNCGCPIDLVYRSGAGSALLDAHAKLEKILRGMNVVSGEIPITVKIRMGTRDNKPTADSLVQRLVLGGSDSREAGMGACGVAAITLHGRSRQQRYTRRADWGYIAEISSLISRLKTAGDAVADTAAEADPRGLANGGKVYFLGNGDCYSHVDYHSHIAEAKVDSVMVGRGALIKPWIFEEIEQGQYLDKSATERLAYIEKFVKYGLDTWGADEMGVGTTRRFLLEWLSFSCRYVPLGILERLPPHINDRPPPFKGRNELETLLSSGNYKDWIKISEMFLGPAHKDFKFTPKHKSNSYEIEAEG